MKRFFAIMFAVALVVPAFTFAATIRGGEEVFIQKKKMKLIKDFLLKQDPYISNCLASIKFVKIANLEVLWMT